MRLPADVLPTRYTLDLSIDPAKDTFEGAVSIELRFDTDTQRFWLHGQDLIVRQATLTSAAKLKIPAKIAIVSADGTAQVTLERPVAAGRAVLDIRYVGQFNPRLQGLYVARSKGGAYVGSQMEPIGARRVLPCFDEPRFKVPFSVSLTVPTGMAAISNAAPVGIETTSDGRRRHRFAATAPLPTYLLAFLVGPYEIVEGQPLAANEVRAEPVALRAMAAHGKGDRLKSALTDTPAMVNYLERYFGIPYRYGKLDLIAVPAFPGGAMENAGAIVYREAALLVPSNASRTQWRNYFTTHTHELAHQWFGNYVTPAWWEDLWLNESFATWLGNKTAHALVPSAAFDRETIVGALKAMEMDSLAQTRRIREPVVRSETIAGAFDAITYLKGGGVLTMIERYMGDERFRAGVRLYLQKYADGVATSEQFFEALAAKAEDPGVLPALRSFVDQPHVPLLQVDMLCATGSDPVARVVQTPYRAVGSAIASDRSWVIPLSFVYEAQGGRKQVQTLMRQARTDITLAGAHCPTWVLPNAAGAGYWRFNLDDDHWLALLGAFANLTPGEQLVTLDSLAAAFRANAVSAITYLQGLDVAVQAGSWDVVLAAARELGEGTVARTLPDNSLLRGRLIRLLGARGHSLVKSHPVGGEEEILRAELARLLVSKAKDRQLIEQLGTAVVAHGYSAFDRDPDLRAATAGATVLLLNGKLPKELFAAALLESDQAKRADVLVGMAGNVALVSLEPILESIQSRKIAAQDLLPLMRELVRNAETRDATWNWMKAHAELLAAQVPELFKSNLPSVAAPFCDASMTAQLEDFFGRHRDDFPGAERTLAQTVEQIRLCAALRTLRADELTAALASASAHETFKDCPECLRMVTIPGGTFTMGSPASEPERRQYEGPQSNVFVASFAISETEVTRGQYATFVRDTNRSIVGSCYTHGDGSDDVSSENIAASWLNPAFEQTADHPVVCVSWQDAKDYAAWLSRKTGQHYRLPSEAEWEYAARAGTTSPFFWGASADRGCDYMNGGDPSLVRALPTWQASVSKALREGDAGARLLDCDDGSPFTSTVGRYKPNAFGLYDMTGNVWEWVEDCWYESLPTSGRARVEDSCKFHRTRGGSWDDFPEDLRAARRARLEPNLRRNDVGFRLVRAIDRNLAPPK